MTGAGFLKSWNQRKFDDAVAKPCFSQDNHSRSTCKGVLKGLHYQLAPEPQAKLVRASQGVQSLMWLWTSAKGSTRPSGSGWGLN